MKWVMIVWTVWMTDGVPTVDVKSSEIYYPDRYSGEAAMEERAQRYAPFTEEGFGYALKCMEREVWEAQRADEAHD